MPSSIVVGALAAAAWRSAGRRERTLGTDGGAGTAARWPSSGPRREAEFKEQAQRTAALFDRMVEGLIVVDAAGPHPAGQPRGRGPLRLRAAARPDSLLEATRHHEVAAVVGPAGPRNSRSSGTSCGSSRSGSPAVSPGQCAGAAGRDRGQRRCDPRVPRPDPPAPARGRSPGIRGQREPRAADPALADQERGGDPPRRGEGRPGRAGARSSRSSTSTPTGWRCSSTTCCCSPPSIPAGCG